MLNSISNNKLAIGLVAGATLAVVAYAASNSIANAASTVFALAPSAPSAQPISTFKMSPYEGLKTFLFVAGIVIGLPSTLKAICMR